MGVLRACLMEAVERRVLLSGTIVDDFQMDPARNATSNEIVEDAAGNLYVAGGAIDAAGVHHALVRRGVRQTDGSVAWSDQPVIDYTLAGPTTLNGPQTSFKDMLIDRNTGDLYVTGQALDAAGGTWWVVVRRSAAGEVSEVDRYRYQPGRTAYATGIAQDAATGNIYVVGEAGSATTTTTTVRRKTTTTTTYDNHWIVRELNSDGTGFETAHDLAGGNGAWGVAAAPSGLYVVGHGDAGLWITQRGVADAAGDLSWTTVDSFQADPAYNSSVWTAGVDAAGNVYTLGRATRATGETTKRGAAATVGEWTVRRTTDAGATWDTIDSFSLTGTGTCAARAFGTDPAGNLYVAGNAIGADGSQHAVVRYARSDGTGWATLDDWQLVAGQSAFTSGFLADSRGGLYVAGSAYGESGYPHGHAIVRRIDPPAGGSTTFSTTAIDEPVSKPAEDQPSVNEEVLA
jgi:hypothetical protein